MLIMILPGILDLIDILFVAIFAWFAIGSLRRTRARSALVGLALVTAVYFIAAALSLKLTASLLQGFFTVVVIVLVVVFQEDLRRFFDGLGAWRPGQQAPVRDTTATDQLARALTRLAASRTGALIVLPGREPLDRHLQGGVVLGGRLSEPLLLSLFDASSPGHDGAVIVRDGKVDRFAVHLPLSSNHEALGPGGTRHAAALGLSERCDAIAIAVSEERGTVSVAREGILTVLARPEDVTRAIADATSEPEANDLRKATSLRDAAIALVAATALWMVFVPGADVGEKTFSVPVQISNLPNELEVESITPSTVEVIVRGSRRTLFLTDEADVSLELDGYLTRFGRRTFEITPDDLKKPAGLTMVSIEPTQVKLSLVERTPAPATNPPPR